MKDIISFFGASVTQQKSGYAVFLSNKLLNDETHIFGYGGNHIDDAGICFIDFFSTYYISINDLTLEYLDTIIYKLTKSNCKIIFLFFLNEFHNDRIQFYTFIKTYLKLQNLYYIDMNDFLEYNTELMRDSFHPSELGSEKYAKIIYDHFQKDKDKIEYPINITKTKYCEDIKVLNVNRIFNDTILLEGNCFIIAFYLIIGKKSGIVEINKERYPIWDQWCHYDRNHFNLKKILVKDNLEIKILQDNLDYSTCRREITELDINKELNIIYIYYIGDSLRIVN